MKSIDTSGILGYVKECRKREVDQFQINISREQFECLAKDYFVELCRILCLADYMPVFSYSFSNGKLAISKLKTSDDPRYDANNRDELQNALQTAARKGQKRFRVLMPPELLMAMEANNAKELLLMEQQLKVEESRRRTYLRNGLLQYETFNVIKEKKYHSDKSVEKPNNKTHSKIKSSGIISLAKMEDAAAFLDSEAAKLNDVIMLHCSRDLYNCIKNGELTGQDGKKISKITELTTHAGIRNFWYTCLDDTHQIKIEKIQYYPGFRVACAAKNGNTSILSSRDQQLLEIAQRLAKDVSALNPADKVAMLSHKIGKMTEYTIDETTDEDDCAYGPLLNQKANCDGYSDAFYLCAKLAGINVRYQIGEFINIKGFHLWNFVEICNKWTSVDVTGETNPNKSSLNLMYCMLGKDRAENLYIWDKEVSPALTDKTDFYRSSFIPEYFCRSVYDVANALHNAKVKSQQVIHLLLANPTIIKDGKALSNCVRNVGIYKTYRYWKIEELNEITIELMN